MRVFGSLGDGSPMERLHAEEWFQARGLFPEGPKDDVKQLINGHLPLLTRSVSIRANSRPIEAHCELATVDGAYWVATTCDC
jgi:hypothetical protein